MVHLLEGRDIRHCVAGLEVLQEALVDEDILFEGPHHVGALPPHFAHKCVDADTTCANYAM